MIVRDVLDRDQPAIADDGRRGRIRARPRRARARRGRPCGRASAPRRRTRRNSSCMSGSRPLVGSSSTSSSGSWNAAWTRPIFCRLPRESSPSGRSRSAWKRSASSRRPAEIAHAAQVGEIAHQLAAGQLAGRRRSRRAGCRAARGSRRRRAGCRARTRGRPLVGCSSPSSVRIVVVLPAPLGPRNPKTSPASTANDTSSIPRALP